MADTPALVSRETSAETVEDVLLELAQAMLERESLNQRVAALRTRVAEKKCPLERGDVLRKKSDRTEWVVVRVTYSLLLDYACEITTLGRPKSGGFDLGKGSVTRGPVQLESYTKTDHVEIP